MLKKRCRVATVDPSYMKSSRCQGENHLGTMPQALLVTIEDVSTMATSDTVACSSAFLRCCAGTSVDRSNMVAALQHKWHCCMLFGACAVVLLMPIDRAEGMAAALLCFGIAGSRRWCCRCAVVEPKAWRRCCCTLEMPKAWRRRCCMRFQKHGGGDVLLCFSLFGDVAVLLHALRHCCTVALLTLRAKGMAEVHALGAVAHASEIDQ
jgi:hypothetical protein